MIASFTVLMNEIGEPIKVVDVDDKIGLYSKEMYFGLKDISKAGTSVLFHKVADADGFLTFYARLPERNEKTNCLRVKAENLFDSSSVEVDSKLLMIILIEVITLNLYYIYQPQISYGNYTIELHGSVLTSYDDMKSK